MARRAVGLGGMTHGLEEIETRRRGGRPGFGMRAIRTDGTSQT
jgi:hypothetical protein